MHSELLSETFYQPMPMLQSHLFLSFLLKKLIDFVTLTGETLCIRAFRRYLVNQLTNLTKGYKETIFRRNPFGRIMVCVELFKSSLIFIFHPRCMLLLHRCSKQRIYIYRFNLPQMKEGYKFVFVTNCSPMGDCKNFDAQFYNALKNKEFFNVKNGGSEMNNSNFRKANNQSGRAGFDLTKCGMVYLNLKFYICCCLMAGLL